MNNFQVYGIDYLHDIFALTDFHRLVTVKELRVLTRTSNFSKPFGAVSYTGRCGNFTLPD